MISNFYYSFYYQNILLFISLLVYYYKKQNKKKLILSKKKNKKKLNFKKKTNKKKQIKKKMSINLTLTSSDNQKIQIDSKSAERSHLLKGLIADYNQKDDIPLPDIKYDILKKVVEYLAHYKDKEPQQIPKPLPSQDLKEVTDEWDVNFINGMELDSVFDLINAANYMDISSLLDLACAKIASLMKGKSAAEIRAMFNIECDLTEDELKEYEEYQI